MLKQPNVVRASFQNWYATSEFMPGRWPVVSFVDGGFEIVIGVDAFDGMVQLDWIDASLVELTCEVVPDGTERDEDHVECVLLEA